MRNTGLQRQWYTNQEEIDMAAKRERGREE